MSGFWHFVVGEEGTEDDNEEEKEEGGQQTLGIYSSSGVPGPVNTVPSNGI